MPAPKKITQTVVLDKRLSAQKREKIFEDIKNMESVLSAAFNKAKTEVTFTMSVAMIDAPDNKKILFGTRGVVSLKSAVFK